MLSADQATCTASLSLGLSRAKHHAHFPLRAAKNRRPTRALDRDARCERVATPSYTLARDNPLAIRENRKRTASAGQKRTRRRSVENQIKTEANVKGYALEREGGWGAFAERRRASICGRGGPGLAVMRERDTPNGAGASGKLENARFQRVDREVGLGYSVGGSKMESRGVFRDGKHLVQ